MAPTNIPISSDILGNRGELNQLLAQPRTSLCSSPAAERFISASGELESEVIRLIKERLQTMSAEDLCYAAWKELQVMSVIQKDTLSRTIYASKVWQALSATEKGKDGAGRSEFLNFTHEALLNFLDGGGEDHDTKQPEGELENEVTKLIKELMRAMFAKDVKDAAWKDLQAMSDAEKRKYGAGTSKGKERMEGDGEDERRYGAGTFKGKESMEGDDEDERKYGAGMSKERERMEGDGEDEAGTSNGNERLKGEGEDEAGTSKRNQRLNGGGEDDLGVQNEDPRSLPKEELKDNELLTPIQRGEKGWSEHLGSGVSRAIEFGKFVVPCIGIGIGIIGIGMLFNNGGKKCNGCASQIKAANEANAGTTGSASPVSLTVSISMFNGNLSVSPRLAWNNREKRGNDVEVSGSK